LRPTILTPRGRLDTITAADFERNVLAALDAGASRLLLDLSDVTYMSSGGLRIALLAARRLRGSGGKLALCVPQASIASLFEISGFNTILSIHRDRAGALSALSR
jgi:anti-anti-sigma factor